MNYKAREHVEPFEDIGNDLEILRRTHDIARRHHRENSCDYFLGWILKRGGWTILKFREKETKGDVSHRVNEIESVPHAKKLGEAFPAVSDDFDRVHISQAQARFRPYNSVMATNLARPSEKRGQSVFHLKLMGFWVGRARVSAEAIQSRPDW
jgi:hypothetical protein